MHSNLIVSVLRNVPYPWQSLISTLLYNFKVSYLNTRHGEVRNLELYLDWNLRVFFSLFVLNGWETELCTH